MRPVVVEYPAKRGANKSANSKKNKPAAPKPIIVTRFAPEGRRRIPKNVEEKKAKGYLPCDQCQDYIRPSNFNAHMESHVVYKQMMYVCYNCDIGFDSLPNLFEHYEEEHAVVDVESEKTQFECMKCGHLNDFCVDLRMHLHEKHQLGNSDACLIRCLMCEEMFNDKNEYERHHLEHLTCRTCNLTFRTMYLHKIHEIEHLPNPKPYECFVCHFRFEGIDFLRYHSRHDHPIPDH